MPCCEDDRGGDAARVFLKRAEQAAQKQNETGDCRGAKDTHDKISVLKDHFYSVDAESRHRKEERGKMIHPEGCTCDSSV